MIPADHITFNDDSTAWLVTDIETAWMHSKHRDRPCDTCDGDGLEYGGMSDDGPGPHGPCPDCHGSGRHTFTINVEQTCPGGGELCGEAGPHPLAVTCPVRVSIVPGMVLPIVRGECPAPTNARHRPAHVHLADIEKRYDPVDSDRAGVCRENADLIWDSPWHAINAIALPPAAAPGMYAVQLRVTA